MIFNFSETTRFHLYCNPVDMRKGIHSLYHLIQAEKNTDALSGDSFVFISRNRKSIKILRWQKEGFILYYKKLELGQYSLPHKIEDEAFFEVEMAIIDHLVTVIKHRSSTNELRKKVVANL